MKIGLKIGIVMLAIMTWICSLKSETKPEGRVETPGVETVGGSDKTEFLKNFYLDYVLNSRDNNFEEIAHDVCTPKLLKFLADNYEYDCDSGDCYAIWLFRTGLQDGPSDENKVTSVTPLEDNWYRVKYVDLGTFGTTCIHFVADDGVLKMDEIK